MGKENYSNICIVTFPQQFHSGSYYIILKNFLKILSTTVNNIYLITGNFSVDSVELEPNTRINIININIFNHNWENIICKTIYHFLIQITISFHLIKIRNQFNGPIFILSGILLLPTITSKLLKKITVLTAVASASTNAYFIYTSLPIYKKFYYYFTNKLLEKITFNAAVYISVESPHVARFMNLPFKKIIGNGHLFFLNKNIKKTHLFDSRPHSIGYIGRLSAEKGVQHFVQALPVILSNQQGLRALIGGDGQLKAGIEASLQKSGMADRVDIPGWIPHEDLPKYLNQLRLLVLPSYTEGLPNIMLEAMACGTPVLATPVGAIPDVIRDGETGFIMEDNSPKCIARNVMRALTHPDLEGIAERGRRLIGEEYTFEKAVERWRTVLNEL